MSSGVEHARTFRTHPVLHFTHERPLISSTSNSNCGAHTRITRSTALPDYSVLYNSAMDDIQTYTRPTYRCERQTSAVYRSREFSPRKHPRTIAWRIHCRESAVLDLQFPLSFHSERVKLSSLSLSPSILLVSFFISPNSSSRFRNATFTRFWQNCIFELTDYSILADVG